MNRGELTKEFGIWLTKLLEKKNQYSVYYDHGKQGAESNVVAIKGFLGDRVTNANRLADVDIMVVSNGKVVLLIEIEEGAMSPKKLLGDIFSSVMCNQFAVKIENENRYFSLSSETRLIIAGVAPFKENRLSRIEDTIMPRLRIFSFPKDGLQSNNIKVVAKTDIAKTIDELENEVRSIFAVG